MPERPPPDLPGLEEAGIGPPTFFGGQSVRGLLLSWGPACVAPALWAYANVPERLRWTSEISSRIFSVVSPLYDELTALEGYGEALEQALLDLRGTPAKILDLATGTGHAALRLKRQYPEAEVTG